MHDIYFLVIVLDYIKHEQVYCFFYLADLSHYSYTPGTIVNFSHSRFLGRHVKKRHITIDVYIVVHVVHSVTTTIQGTDLCFCLLVLLWYLCGHLCCERALSQGRYVLPVHYKRYYNESTCTTTKI